MQTTNFQTKPRAPDPSPGAPASHARHGDDALEPRPSLRCAICESEISSREQLIALTPQGPVERFVNPFGRFCELFTLRDAQGWAAVSQPTEEASWFPGYAWEILACTGCGSHLGWRYLTRSDREPAAFFGLLCEALQEG